MLSVTRVSTAQAQNYYSKDDYYLETAGEWQGKGADELELEGKVHEDDFNSLINGKAPNKEFDIAKGGKKNTHTAGADLTFSAPKSVSIMALAFDDKQIQEAHNLAVTRTLEYIESNLMGVRKKEDGKVNFVKTDNMITAKFMHVSSRELDTQLHTHCVVINASKNESGEWRAVDYSKIFNSKMDLGLMYRNELAQELQKLGYQIEADDKGLFEIAGFNKDLLNEFSQRSKQIEERYQELRELYPNASKAELKQQATLETRQSKNEPSLQELKAQWQERIAKYNVTIDNVIDKSTPVFHNENNLNDAVNRSVEILTETEALISQEKIISVTNKLNLGKFSNADIIQNIQDNPNIIHLENGKLTTKDIQQKEQNIIDTVKNGINTQAPLLSNQELIKSHIERYEQDKGFRLSMGQGNAVKHILSSTDKYVAIQGDAGTGKTTMLEALNQICSIEHQNHEIVGLSFTGKAALEIQTASGIGSSTIASFVNSQEPINPETNRIYVIDEASMLSIKDMDAIIKKCESENAKIVLLGDTKQLQSIGAGKVFQTLQEQGIIATVEIKESKRQSEQIYKESAQLMANHKAKQAYELLDKNNMIVQEANKDKRLELIKDEYCNNHKDTILVTATNADRESLNAMIRDQLQSDGKVSTENTLFDVRESKALIAEDKFFASKYSVGDVIIAHDNILGKKGNEIKITQIDTIKQTITGVDKNNQSHTINVSQHGNLLNVFKEQQKNFAKNDKIIFLKNDKGLGVNNGQTATIQNIDPKSKTITVEFEDGKTKKISVDKQYKYIAHGYAITDYKSQGQTAKNVIYHADNTVRVNFNQAYVGITRGKEQIRIFTDDKQLLSKNMGIKQDKTSSLGIKAIKQRISELKPDVNKIKKDLRHKINSLFKSANPKPKKGIKI